MRKGEEVTRNVRIHLQETMNIERQHQRDFQWLKSKCHVTKWLRIIRCHQHIYIQNLSSLCRNVSLNISWTHWKKLPHHQRDKMQPHCLSSHWSHLTTAVISVLSRPRLISMGSLSHCKNGSVRNTGWFKPFAFTLAWSCFSSFKWKGDLASCWGLYNNHNNYLNCSVTAAKCSYFP